MKNKKSRVKQSNETGFILPIEFKRPKTKIIYASMFLFFVLVSMIFFIPIMWMLLSAFKDTREFLQVPPTFLPEQFSFQKIIDVWNMTAIGKTYINSLLLVVGEIFATLSICGLAGYVLSRLKPAGYKVILALVLWTMMLPTNLGMVPRFLMFIKLPVIGVSLADTYYPMWMLAGANCFNVILFKNFFDNISASYIEAAKIDGGGELGIFFRIILPLSKPILMTVSIFTLTAGWGEFFWPYMLLKSDSLQTIGVKVFTLQSALPIDQYMMMLVLVILPPMILFLFLQRYITEGVSSGGVKG